MIKIVGGITGYATIQIKLDGKLYDLCPTNQVIIVREWGTREQELIDLGEAVK